MKDLMIYYLTPNTRKKEVLSKLYQEIGKNLSNLTKSLLNENEQLNQVNIHVSDTEKLWAFLCGDKSPIKRDVVKGFLDDETFDRYNKLSKSILLNQKNHDESKTVKKLR